MTTTSTSTLKNPVSLAEHYAQIAEDAAKRKRTLIGICPHCRGNVVRITVPPGKQVHAQCLQCSRDLCCPAIRGTDLSAKDQKTGSKPRKQLNPRGKPRR